MLRLCDNVEEAVAQSNRWQIPLLIFVHSSLQESDVQNNNNNNNNNAPSNTDIPGFYTIKPRGKKLVNATFQLGVGALARDGAAQKHALEIILKDSRLADVTVIHFMEAGSAAHNLFITAVPESNQIVPRLHIFPPSLREMPRNVLHSTMLTTGRICETVRLALQMPPLAKLTESRDEFVQQVEEMNTSLLQSQSFSTNTTNNNEGIREAVTNQQVKTNATTSTSTSSSSPSTGGTESRGGLHFVALNGLEKREVIVTSPGMTLQTVWKKVIQALKREKETAITESRPYNGSLLFYLRVEPSSSSNNNNTCDRNSCNTALMITSIDEAAKMDIHTLPHNTIITVVRENTNSGSVNISTSNEIPHVVKKNEDKKEKLVVNDEQEEKEKEKKVTKKDDNTQSSPTTSPTLKKPENEEENETEKTESNQGKESIGSPTTLRIKLRCSLPDGNTYTVEDLDPLTATLSSHVRYSIEELLGHSSFVFARAYPPRRFTPQEETQKLHSIGITTSSVLRVVPTVATSALPKEQLPPTPAGVSIPGLGLRGLVSSLLQRATGAAAPAPVMSANNNNNNNNNNSNRGGNGGRFRTMVDIRAEEEEEENRRAAMESAGRQQRRGNRYYDGNSTEFMGRDNSANEEEEEDEDDDKNGGKKNDNEAVSHAKKNS